MSDGRGTAAGRLARLGFRDATASTREWAAVGCDDERLLEQLAAAADPDLALRTLTSLLARPGVGDLRQALGRDPRLGRRLTLVLGASSALGSHLLRHPEDWRELADPALEQVRPTAAALHTQLSGCRDRDDLRRRYRRLLLRLAARDLSLPMQVDDAAAELADLATAALSAALALAVEEVGEPAARCRLAVIALGKCGARELNYVSDVDVVFVAEPVDGGDGDADEASALRAATAVASALVRICSDSTAEGTLWPLDAGLRPEGNAGPLVRTLASHAAYYDRWAKTWEFQALLKARPAAGDAELGARYMESIAVRAWSAASRPDFVADVQAMRRRVLRHVRAADADRQIKLGPGGLRDVEFAVQLLQLVHGRTDTSVRQPDTLSALAALTAGGYVGRDDAAALGEAYRFLRLLEHRLQLRALRRTSVVPADESSRWVLGRSLGLMGDPVGEFTRQWRSHAMQVRRLHEKLFYRPLLAAVAALPSGEARLTPEAARQRLEALGYADPASALRHLEALTSGVSRRAAIQRTLLPAMLGWFADAPDPDAGLLGFHRLSDALGSSHWYLRTLRDEGAAAERLARILATSRYATDLLMRAPDATALLARDEDLLPRERDALLAECRTAADRQSDPTQAVAAVRAVRRRELFRIAVADLLGLLDVNAVGRALSDVAEATIDGALRAAVAAEEAGRGTALPVRLAVVALGRLGGREMSYGSDADVVYVHEPPDGRVSDEDAAKAAHAVASELSRLLALPGADPALRIDAGLRPEGKQGPLVRTLASYDAYYRSWGKLWESQALLRARPVAGDEDVGLRFVELADRLRYPDGGLSDSQVAEVRRIKARMEAERLPKGVDPATHLKLGPGGLSDVEWTVQLLQLRFGGELPGLRTAETLAALSAATSAGLVSGGDAAMLGDSWRLASRIRNAAMLVRGRPSDTLPHSQRDRGGVAFVCGYRGDPGRLTDDYRRTARRARAAVERVFWG